VQAAAPRPTASAVAATTNLRDVPALDDLMAQR